jgi:hypothetical protein
MAEMDLNINNYSITDLENFFKVQSKKYSFADIEKREYTIREQLLSSGHIDKKCKRDLVSFLKQAKDRLNQQLPQEKPPTIIPKNAILDTDQTPRSAELATSRMPLIIERPPTQYINVQQSEFFQGTMNPLNKRTITKYITVDTRFRDRYYETSSSNFMLNLPTRINKVVSLQLTSLELPKDFYSISESYGNNFFFMQVFQMINGVGYEGDRTLIIPDGNYTAQGLIDKINNILCPIDSNGDMENPNDIFSYILFSLITGSDGSGSNRVMVRVNPAYPQVVSQIEEIVLNFGMDILGNNDSRYLTTKIGWNLGFTNTIYYGNTEFISEKSIEPNAIKYIYLSVDDYNKSVNTTFMTAFEKNGLKPNILARISMSGKGYDNVLINKEYEIISEPRIYFGPVDIQRLHINLFDDHGRTLNMNYSDFAFCLKATILYDL